HRGACRVLATAGRAARAGAAVRRRPAVALRRWWNCRARAAPRPLQLSRRTRGDRGARGGAAGARLQPDVAPAGPGGEAAAPAAGRRNVLLLRGGDGLGGAPGRRKRARGLGWRAVRAGAWRQCVAGGGRPPALRARWSRRGPAGAGDAAGSVDVAAVAA